MGKILNILSEDFRFEMGLKSCINCGTCTAICPAAEFYNYDPRRIINIVQLRDEDLITDLLKSNTIWYCGECMSCVTRCPRNNAVGLLIIALRSLSQDLGYFVESEKGRQQLILKRTIGTWLLKYGYCIYPKELNPENYLEAGPVWKWVYENMDKVYNRLGANLGGDGNGILRKIPKEALDELDSIFSITGAKKKYEIIELYSINKAQDMKLEENDYLNMIYNENIENHWNED